MLNGNMLHREAKSENIETDAQGESGADRPTGFLRRTVVKAGAVTVGTLGMVGSTAAQENEIDGRTETRGPETGQIDEPEGFSAEVLAEHGSVVDDVAVGVSVLHEEGDEDATIVRDPANVVVLKATWEPGGTIGWHRHPGPVIVNVAKGELEVTLDVDGDCVTQTYSAGEAFFETGSHAEIATNPSEDEETVLYVTILGVPDGEDPAVWVEPRDC